MMHYPTLRSIVNVFVTGLPILYVEIKRNTLSLVDMIYIINWVLSIHNYIVKTETSMMINLLSMFYLSYVRTLRFFSRQSYVPLLFIFILWHGIFSYDVNYIKCGILLYYIFNIVIIHAVHYNVGVFYHIRLCHISSSVLGLLICFTRYNTEFDTLWASVLFQYWCAVSFILEDKFLIICKKVKKSV